MNRLLIICGPTATGKTDVAVSLAKKFNGELISADSRQVYCGMDIGTGKDKEKLQGVPIWMYDVVKPDEKFSVSQYRVLARLAMDDIWSRGKLPIIVGGTGLYIDSLYKEYSAYKIPPNDSLRKELSVLSVEKLQEMFQSISPENYAVLNNSEKHNSRRLIRKIELVKAGEEKTVIRQDSLFHVLSIGLTLPTRELEHRIDLRVDTRVAAGQRSEVKKLLSQGYLWKMPSMSGLGYIQWKRVIEGTGDTKDAISDWKIKELQYAKRQMTWFKKQKNIIWFDASNPAYLKDVTKSVLAWYTENINEHKN